MPVGTTPSIAFVYKDGKKVPSSAYDVAYHTYDDHKYVGSTFPTMPGHYYMYATGKGSYYGSAMSAGFYVVKKLGKSTINLAAQAKTCTGNSLAYSGAVTKTGSTGKVTYTYYSDAACTKVVADANVTNAGTYYVKATLAAGANHNGATSAAAKLTIASAAQPMKLKAVKRTAKAPKVKKKAVTVAAPLKFTKKARGKVTYAKVAKGSAKCLMVSKKTG